MTHFSIPNDVKRPLVYRTTKRPEKESSLILVQGAKLTSGDTTIYVCEIMLADELGNYTVPTQFIAATERITELDEKADWS